MGPTSSEERDAVEAALAGLRLFGGVIAETLAMGRAVGGMTAGQLRALIVVAGRASTTTTDLAQHVGVSLSSASRIVDRLVAAGLLSRSRDGSDGRRVALATTPAGREVIDRVLAERRAVVSDLVSRLAEDERAALTRGLRALVAAADPTEQVVLG